MDIELTTEQTDSWTPENTNASNPKFIPNNSNTSNGRSSRYLHNADFIKLKNISLGYSLPKSLIKKILLQNVRIYVSADNLITWNLDKIQKLWCRIRWCWWFAWWRRYSSIGENIYCRELIYFLTYKPDIWKKYPIFCFYTVDCFIKRLQWFWM